MLPKNLTYYDCPYCGATLGVVYEPVDAPYILAECCECGGTFKCLKSDAGKGGDEYLQRELNSRGKDVESGVGEQAVGARPCPVCGSDEVLLYNRLKQIYHCRCCDAYFTQFGSVIPDPSSPPKYNNRRGDDSWSGFTDPDDPAKDGLGNRGW